MKKHILILMFAICCGKMLFAQNPFIMDQFTADPSARVFGNRVYVYPSHDIRCSTGKGRSNWFCMEDYHVFSSSNLTEWIDHGVIISQNKVPWANPDSYSMWAPDCIYRNGKYYFYFPTKAKDTVKYSSRFRIGIAIADKPFGPFILQTEPIKNVLGIDPNVFIDNDGQAYIYWSDHNIYAAKLNKNMLELDSKIQTLGSLPEEGLKEGPFLFVRKGIYYLTYPHVENKTERLEYAIGDNPLGPFKTMGVLMDESSTGCWTNHHSIISFNDQWYLFYHHNDLSPNFDKNRSIRMDSLFFNLDGTIKKVAPSLRGVGLTKANDKIQVDRYSTKSENGISIAFIDTLNRFEGWKTVFNGPEGWIQYNSIDFGNGKQRFVNMKARSVTGGILQIQSGKSNDTILAQATIPNTKNWVIIRTKVKSRIKGVHNLLLNLKTHSNIEVDWVSFE